MAQMFSKFWYVMAANLGVGRKTRLLGGTNQSQEDGLSEVKPLRTQTGLANSVFLSMDNFFVVHDASSLHAFT